MNDTWVESQGKILTVTKGDYKNRVELSWETNNSSVINNFGIYRRELSNSNSEYIKIGENPSEVQHFVDYNTEPYKLYQYRVNAVVPSCDEASLFAADQVSKHLSPPVVGFRTPYSNIYGQIVYDGSGAVDNAEVSATPIDPSLSKSLHINNSNNTLNFPIESSNFSFMSWILVGNQISNPMTLISGFGDSSSSIMISSNSKILINGMEYGSKLFDWHHIAVSYNNEQSNLNIYLDGVKIVDDLNINYSIDSNLIIGEEFNGLLDEISFWSVNLSDEFISTNCNKFIKHDTNGLIAYYHCDEGIGNYLYDSSVNQNNILNKNHLELNSTSDNFSSLAPSTNKIRYAAMSNSDGYYGIEEVRFGYTGSNFEITPRKTDSNSGYPHEFSPSYLTAFLGDDIDYVSNFNFNDISSFRVTGNVYYLDPNSDYNQLCSFTDSNSPEYDDSYLIDCSTTINNNSITNFEKYGVEGVKILVDGEEIYGSDGNIETTNSNGYFDIDVPIGLHEISIVKDGHTFVNEVWNTPTHITFTSENGDVSKLYNFEEDKHNLEFYDNTKRTLVGKVCGGLSESSKSFDEIGVNNIGQASFVISDEYNKHHIQIQTNINSGKYSANLLPEIYDVKLENGKKISITENPDAENFFNNFSFSSIDMSNTIDDNLTYDKILNFVYRTPPQITAYNFEFINENNQVYFKLGESEWNILNQEFDDSIWVDLPDINIPLIDSLGEYQFTAPIFKKGKDYDLIVPIYELYNNVQSDQIYLDPVTGGGLTLSDSENNSITFDVTSDQTILPFLPSEVNTSLNGTNSFQKNFTLTYQDGDHTASVTYPYYVFGSQVDEGLNYFSTGPEVVEMVLRDPPGDLSYSFIESGSSTSNNVEVYSAGDVFLTICKKI